MIFSWLISCLPLQLGKGNYQRVCTCLYEDDRATAERDGDGKVSCEYYDGKAIELLL